jgi:hypothetical protein
MNSCTFLSNQKNNNKDYNKLIINMNLRQIKIYFLFH